MTRKQVVLVIGINAVISTLISLAVALLVTRTDVVTSILPARATGSQAAAPGTDAAGSATGDGAGASLTLTATLGVSPDATPIIHVVQSGDTISGLAFKYDVPEKEIIAANELKNPNFLQLGMELIIPVGGVPNATPTFTPAPTTTDTPIPFDPPSAQMTATAGAPSTPLATALPATNQHQVEITDVLEPGELENEAVVLINAGEGLADMRGWVLNDAEGNQYAFARLTLWPGGSVTVHTGIGENDPTNLFWGEQQAVWSLGETATLLDSQGQTVASFVVGQ
jgi:LysM repeat protein